MANGYVPAFSLREKENWVPSLVQIGIYRRPIDQIRPQGDAWGSDLGIVTFDFVRGCLKIPRSAVFAKKGWMAFEAHGKR